MSIKPPETEKPRILSDALAGEREERGRTEQLDVYARLKAHQELVSSYILSDFPRLVKEHRKLLDCGSHLVFHNFYRVNIYLLRNGFFCKQHLLCLPCAFRRSGVYTHTYKQAVRYLLDANPGLLPVLITKTVKDGADLKERYRHLAKAHSALMQRRRDALKTDRVRTRTPTVLRHVHGAAGAFEFKRGKNSGLWHPHSHEVALIDRHSFEFTYVQEPKRIKVLDDQGGWTWIDGTPDLVLKPLEFEAALSNEWLSLTKDSWIVDVRVIDIHDPKKFHGAIAECFKYALKMNDLEPDDQVTAYLSLRTCRMIYSYGCLRSVEVPEDESRDESEIDLSDEPWYEEHLNWFRGQYRLYKTLPSEEALFPAVEPAAQKKKAASPKRGKFSAITSEHIKDWLDSMSKAPF